MIKKFYIKLQLDIPQQRVDSLRPDYEIAEDIKQVLYSAVGDEAKATVIVTKEPEYEKTSK
ncbi:MAG: hypothetical protein ACI4TT_03825 [Christensenellales bacterium]